MVAKGYGSSDSDIRKGSKEKTDKPMLKASAKLPTTGMIGGVHSANKAAPTFKRGGNVNRKR